MQAQHEGGEGPWAWLVGPWAVVAHPSHHPRPQREETEEAEGAEWG